MGYITVVCHLEDCPSNENRECKYMGELSIVKIVDKEKNMIRAECAVYRDATVKFVDENKSINSLDFVDQKPKPRIK